MQLVKIAVEAREGLVDWNNSILLGPSVPGSSACRTCNCRYLRKRGKKHGAGQFSEEVEEINRARLDEETFALKRPKLFLFNVLLTVVLSVCLCLSVMAAHALFIVAFGHRQSVSIIPGLKYSSSVSRHMRVRRWTCLQRFRQGSQEIWFVNCQRDRLQIRPWKRIKWYGNSLYFLVK